MIDVLWPADLKPSTMEFWIEEHTASSTSPFTRQGQVVVMPGARWICRMAFNRKKGRIKDRIQSLLDLLEGRANPIGVFDFSRQHPSGRMAEPFIVSFSDGTGFSDGTIMVDTAPLPPQVSGESYGKFIPVKGWMPSVAGLLVMGDYVTLGDGRLHRLTADFDTNENGDGVLQVTPRIPATYPVPAGQPVIWTECRAYFRAKTDDVGKNPTVPGEFTSYTLELEQVVPCPI